jgi:hypothetical protein
MGSVLIALIDGIVIGKVIKPPKPVIKPEVKFFVVSQFIRDSILSSSSG